MSIMTQRLFRRLGALPAADQEALADYLQVHFQELLSEARWERLFQSSPTTLDHLSAEVDQAIADGDVHRHGPSLR
jgi:hypothetical protein